MDAPQTNAPQTDNTLNSLDDLSFSTHDDLVVAHKHLSPGARHVMVAIDQSVHSLLAVRFAFESIARPGDVISVVEALPPVDAILGRQETPGDMRRDAMIDLHSKIKTIRSEVGQDQIPFRIDIDWGDPRSVILDLAKRHSASFLVVGSRGRSAIKGALLGSVSQYILAHADMPVVIVRIP